MAEMKKVFSNDVLRKEPRRDSDLVVSAEGDELQLQAGEVVNTGAKPSQDEVLPDRTITWVFVETTGGPLPNLRKGFLSIGNLRPVDTFVPTDEVIQVFHEQVDKESFTNTCYLQAMLTKTNPAYLYALAFALSGDQWSATDVKTDDPPDAPAFGVFRFPKETWQRLLSEPEATNILPDDIKFPEVQCVVAAIVAAKSGKLLESLITDRGFSAVDLLLAHLFADKEGFGSNATAMILQAEKDNKTQPSEAVIRAIYPESAVRAAFFKRNAGIFKADGSATIEQALAVCATKLESGFAEVRKLADEVEADAIGDGIPSSSTGPIQGGVGATGDSVAGIKGGIDRSRFSDELAQKPLLRNKILRIAANEQGSHPQGTQAVLESMMNRAEVRGTSLEAQAKWHESEGGYYQQGNMGSGALENAAHRAILEQSLKNVLGGSNISNYATDNASGDLAARGIKSGRFLFCSTFGGETFSVPSEREQPENARRWREWRRRLGSAGSEPSTSQPKATEPPSIMPGARLADSGKPPVAFVVHHTGPASSVAGIVNDWRTHHPGIGTQYIMDREGVIHDVEKEFGYRGHGHVLPSATPSQFLRQGIVNPNIVGMEVMARDDADVTAKQVEAAMRFIHENYPNTPVYGHGELNPGHREASEGRTIVQAIRRERAQEEQRK